MLKKFIIFIVIFIILLFIISRCSPDKPTPEDSVANITDGMGDAGGNALDSTKNAVSDAGSAVGNMVGSAKDAGGNALDSTKNAVSGAGSAVGDMVGSAKDAAGNGLDSTENAVNDAGSAVGSMAGSTKDAAGNALDSTKNAVSGIGSAVGDMAGSAKDTVGNALDSTENAVSGAGSTVGDIAGSAKDAGGNALDAAGNTLGSVGNRSVNASSAIAAKSGSELGGIPSAQNIATDDELVDADELQSEIVPGSGVTLKGVTFKFNSSELESSSFSVLDEAIRKISNMSNKIEVAGFTDNVGSNFANKKMSEKRAETVLNYLISKGIDGNRLNAKGYGDKFPIADNATIKGQNENRRVELFIK